MSPAHDADHDMYDEVPTRSIFAATWFRVVLIVIVLGVIGAIAVPYVLDWMNPPIVRPPVAAKPPAPTAAATAPGSTETAPAEKKDSTLIPAPVAPPVSAPAPARPAETRTATDAKSTPPAATKSMPPAESKSATPSATTGTPAATAKAPMPSPARSATAKGDAGTAPGSGDTRSALAVGETPKPAGAKPEASAKSDATAKSGAPATSTAVAAATTSAAGPFWVQVGAFKDAETAKRLAGKLREDNFKVEETTTRVGGGASTTKGTTAKAGDAASDRYDVYVSGPSADEVNKRLADKGLTVESAAGVLIVKPSLPLRDAVALSKDLAAEGFKVQVKRAGGAAGTPATAAVANSSIELHRVRVGSFADRAAAQAAARDLEAKGYKPYIARGDR